MNRQIPLSMRAIRVGAVIAWLVGCSGSASKELADAAQAQADASTNGQGAQDGAVDSTEDADAPDATSPPELAPALKPELLLVSYLGGANDQYFSEVSFDANGHVIAHAADASLDFDIAKNAGVTTGDLTVAMDISKFPVTYPLPKGGLSTNTLEDPRNGQTYTWGTHPNVAKKGTPNPDYCTGLGAPGDEIAAFLQMAFFKSSAGYTLWDFAWDACVKECAVADSRGYDVWLSAGNKVGMMLWTDGGNTPLKQDPADVSKKAAFLEGSFGEDPGGMGTLFALIDPKAGRVESGTWLATHVVFHTNDPWGRVYTNKALSIRYGKSDTPKPTNPFGMSDKASSGLMVLREDFKQPAFNAYLGGDPSTCADPKKGIQQFDAIALKDNYLALAGTTCVNDLKTTDNAPQKSAGGGQDGFLVVLKLW